MVEDAEAIQAAQLPDSSAGFAVEESANEQPLFFPVSARKFIVMSVFSGGLYALYWSYRNWKYIKQVDSSKIMPFWRAWFVLFFHYSLIKRIKEETSKRTVVLYGPLALTIWYFLLILAWRLPGGWGYIGYLDFVPLLPVIWAINSANEGRVPDASMNTRFTRWNLVLVGLSAILIGLDVFFWIRPDFLPS